MARTSDMEGKSQLCIGEEVDEGIWRTQSLSTHRPSSRLTVPGEQRESPGARCRRDGQVAARSSCIDFALRFAGHSRTRKPSGCAVIQEGSRGSQFSLNSRKTSSKLTEGRIARRNYGRLIDCVGFNDTSVPKRRWKRIESAVYSRESDQPERITP